MHVYGISSLFRNIQYVLSLLFIHSECHSAFKFSRSNSVRMQSSQAFSQQSVSQRSVVQGSVVQAQSAQSVEIEN